MRVFVTGASGFIGSALVPELIGAGHQVVGLARSDASAEAVSAAGAQVQRGTIEDLEVLRAAAAASDGVVHLAFNHEQMSDFTVAAQAELHAIDALGSALEGSDRPLVIASGTLGLAPGRVSTERDWPDPAAGPVSPRQAGARAVQALATRGVRSSILRLAPSVHGEVKAGFVGYLIDIARAKGVSGYIGDGSNRWTAVHRRDAARLFRLALEKAPAGSVLHAAGDEGLPTRDIADVIGRHLGVPVTSIAPEDAAGHFGWIAPLFALDAPTSTELTRELLGWQPTYPGLIENLEAGHYFKV